MKECFKCKVVKPLDEFYKHSQMADGHLNKCKQCTKKDVGEHREKNIEKVRAYDRERGKNKGRIQAQVQITKAWREEDRRRSRAHSAVARAIRSGALVRQPCESCNDESSVAHHDDYDKPLSVRWLCQACHKRHHAAT
ncbi:restriction endonuclease paci restriction endonuclease [Caudoviricetes sp.]|nr:restriction endonuclease paci restriction endonuclease [Caudoviricetes sp.]